MWFRGAFSLACPPAALLTASFTPQILQKYSSKKPSCKASFKLEQSIELQESQDYVSI